jgi:ABC-type sugar transport system substrate-binding protein
VDAATPPGRKQMKIMSAWLRAICLGAAMAFVAVAAPAQNAATVPQFQVDPFWPQPLPNN